MVFKWVGISDKVWHLFVVPAGAAHHKFTTAVAMTYRFIPSEGWKGWVFSDGKVEDAVDFPGMDSLKEMKALLETTVALRSSGDEV